MTPKVKFHTYVFTATTFAIFYLWTLINKIVVTNDTTKLLVGLITSFGCYKIIIQVALFLTEKSSFIKKFILGPSYLEGTWVGFYIGAEGKPRFFVERFEQDIDSLVIRGKSNNDEHKYHASWVAVAQSIDTTKGQLTYMYDIFSVNDKSNNNGIAIFNFERDNQYKPAKMLFGFSTDLHIGKRIRSIERKLSNNCSIKFEIAIEESIKLYEENKDKF